jgi:hypothetical protein
MALRIVESARIAAFGFGGGVVGAVIAIRPLRLKLSATPDLVK